ncbi:MULTISPECIES: hypothetical protein [Peribacillus]|uniref:Uncharacterized protein n=1 Tax=Peribacillus asahii TaxID=228899 RepID=A0A3T0KUV2_9BACI|nr:hypothetical protein [Peribacillus asahii]AZV44100.1 hypothetical protein BAOM_3491 [Peribacillus asahii]USK58594.1 hypothetical protein LIT37_15310 [Peribacillus asahii]USK83822.1 hypothetical protein LIT35_15420 [Peribacillus asahii]
MRNKNVAIDEMLAMIADIHSSLDGLEKSYGLAVNTERCKLWAEQYKMVNQTQEALDAVESSLKQSPAYSIKLEKVPKNIQVTPSLGY